MFEGPVIIQHPGVDSAGASDSDRLDSWKEIAAHVRRDIRTVQRWEKQEGLPVHRHTHNRLGTVHGYRQEIDAWLEGRRDLIPPQPGPHRTFKPTIIVSVAVAVLLAASGLSFRAFVTGKPDPVALKVVPLTTYPGDVGGGAFSPDGSHVAFSWNGKNQDNYDIYVKVLDAETPLRLTTDGAPDGFAAWSPDGRASHSGEANGPGPHLPRFTSFHQSAGRNGEWLTSFQLTITSHWQGSRGLPMESGWHIQT